MKDLRDFDKNPITAEESIAMFMSEDSDLAIASRDVIEQALQLAEKRGMYYVASDIGSRYDDYQEELRAMMAEFY